MSQTTCPLHIPCTPSCIPTIQLGQYVYYLSLVSSVSHYIISAIQLHIQRFDIIDMELCSQFLDSNVRGVVNMEQFSNLRINYTRHTNRITTKFYSGINTLPSSQSLFSSYT